MNTNITPLSSEKFFSKYPGFSGWSIEKDVVWLGKHFDPTLLNSPDFSYELQNMLSSLIPWRKGPWGFGSPQNPILTLHAEWQSHFKWFTFLQKASPDFSRKIVLDLGCNNGYYLFHALSQNPSQLFGWDPSDLYKNQFDFLQNFAKEPRIQFLKYGWQSLPLFSKSFDIILCFGILYHHTDPIAILSSIQQSLKNKGFLYLESLGIDQDGSFALVPSKTYANAKGMWFIPTQRCLENWLSRSGFHNIKFLNKSPLSIQEQRTTPYSPYPSLKEGLDNSLQNTIEGYPPPYRFLFQAQK